MPETPELPVNLSGAPVYKKAAPVTLGGAQFSDLSSGAREYNPLDIGDANIKPSGYEASTVTMAEAAPYRTGRYDRVAYGYDNEEAAAQRQSSLDKAANGILKGVNLTATTIAGGFGMLYGLAKSPFSGRFADVWDNPALRALDDWNKEVDDKYLPNYYTKAEKEAAWYSTDNWLTMNFLFDKLIKNSGYAVGAMLSGNIVNAGLLRFGSVLGRAAAASATASRSSEAFKLFTPLLRNTARAFSSGKNIEAAAELERGISSIADITAKSSELAKIARTTGQFAEFGDTFRKTAVAVYSSAGESSFEALQTADEFRNNLIQEYVDKYGEQPSGKDLEDINTKSERVGKMSFFGNLALLGATEFSQLNYLLGSSYKNSRKALGTYAKRTDDVVMREGKYVADVPVSKLETRYEKFKKVGGYVYDPKESFQELGQYAIQVGTQNYFKKAALSDDASVWTDGFLYGFFGRDEQGEGEGAFVSKEGMESALLGGLTGGAMQAIGKRGEQKALASNTAKFLTALNSTPSFKQAFVDKMQAVNRGVVLQQQHEASIISGNELEARDIRTDITHNYLAPRIKYGRFDMVMDDIAEMKITGSTEEGLSNLKAQGIGHINDTVESFNKRLSAFETVAKNTNEIYNGLYIRFASDVNEKGEPKYSPLVIDKMAYAASKIADYDLRIPQLNSQLIDSGIIVEDLLENILKGIQPSRQATAQALNEINDLPVLSTTKDGLKTALQDIIKLGQRRRTFMEEYEDIKENPLKYQSFGETMFGETEELPVGVVQEVPKEKGKKRKQKFTEKKIEVGQEYSLVEPLRKERTSLYIAPKVTVLSQTLGGELEVVTPSGQIRFISPEDIAQYNLSEEDNASEELNKIVDEVIDEVLNKPKYRGLPEREADESKIDYINSLYNQSLTNDVEKGIKERYSKFYQEKVKQQAVIKKESSKKALEETSDEETLITRDIDSGNFEPERKKTKEQVPSSTKPPVEGYSQKEPLAEHHKRSNRFGSRFYTLPNRDNFRGIIVTQKNEESVGLSGLMQFLKDKGKEGVEIDPSKTIALVVVEVDPVTGQYFLIGEDGKRLDKPSLETAIYQTFPETLTWSQGDESMFRKDVPEETAKAISEDFTKWRGSVLESPDSTLYKISASFGSPQYEGEFDENGKFVYDKTATISVEDSALVTQKELNTTRVIGVPTTDGAFAYGSSTFNNVKGVPLLFANNGMVRLRNKNFSKSEAENIFNAIERLASNLAKDGNLKSNESVFLYNWLKSVIYWGTPKYANGERKPAAFSSIFFEDGKLLIGKEEKAFSIVPADLRNKKAEIVEEIQKMYGNVNSTLVSGGKTQEWNKPYLEITNISEKGIETREWKNYQTFLLSNKNPDGSKRNPKSIPLTTRIRAVKDSADTNRKGIYFTVIDKKSSISEKPSAPEVKKQVVTPTPEGKKEPKPSAKFDLETKGVENIIETKIGKFPFTIDINKFKESDGLQGINLPNPDSDMEYSMSLEQALVKLSKISGTGLREDMSNDEAFPIVENIVLNLIRNEVNKQIAPVQQPTAAPAPVSDKKADIETAFDYITTRKYKGEDNRLTEVNKVGEDLTKRFVATLKEKGLVKEDYRMAPRTDGSVERMKVNTDAEGNNLGNDWSTAGKFKDEFRKFVDAELAALEGAKPTQSSADLQSLRDEIQRKKREGGGSKRASDYSLMLANDSKGILPENWSKVESWLKANFPNIPVYRVKNYILNAEGKRAHGLFENGAIYLSENAEIGTVYHEVFHAIWQSLTDVAERTAITNEFRQRKGEFFDKKSLKNVKYSEATYKQMEERLAEEFRDYIQQGKVVSEPKSLIARLFRDLVNFFKSFFTGANAKENSEKLFNKIGTGYYAKSTMYDSALSYAKMGLVNIEDFTGGEFGDYSLMDSFTGEEVHDLMQHLTWATVRDFISEDEGLFKIENPSKVELYGSLKQEMVDLFSENIVEIGERRNKGEISEEKEAIEVARLETFYNNVTGNWDEIVDKHQEYLKSYNIEFDENDELEFKEYEKSKDDPYGDPRRIDNMRKTNSAIKLLLASLPVVNSDGSVKTTQSFGGYMLYPMSEVFIGVMNQVHSARSVEEMLSIIENMSIEDPKYIKLYNRLVKSQEKEKGISKLEQPSSLRLLSAFWRSFKKQSPLVKTVYILDNGDIQVGDSNFTTASRQVEADFINGIKKAITDGSELFLKADNGKSFIGNKNAIELKKEDKDDIKKQVAFLKELNIEFDLDRIQRSKYLNKFSIAVNGIRTSIAEGKSVMSIGGRTLAIAGRLKELSEIKAMMDNPEFSSTFYNVNGELTQTFIGTNAASDLYHTLSKIQNIRELANTQYSYLLTDSFSKNSVLLYKMFDKESGDRIEGTEGIMEVGYADGTVNQDTGKQKESSRLNAKERFLQEINLNLSGYYLNLIPGDAKIEWMMYMGNAISESDILLNYNKVLDVFKGYLEDEIALTKEQRIVAKGKNANELRFFKSIFENDSTLEKDVLEFDGDINELYEDYGERINKAILDFLNKEATQLNLALKDYGSVTEVEGKVTSKDLSIEDGLTTEQFNNKMFLLSTNYAINNIELHKLLYSDPYFYSDELKRIKNFASPRQSIVNSSPGMNTAFHNVWNKGFSNKDAAFTDFEKDYFRSATFSDVSSTGDLNLYDEWEETDGGGIIILKAVRNFKIRAGEWDNDQERQYKYDMVWKKDFDGEKLNEKEKRILADGNPNVRRTYTPIKPIVSGPKYNNRPWNDVLLDKFSLYPLSFRVAYEINKNSNALKLYDKMMKENVDYGVFKSGRKVGAEKTFDLYDKDGKFNTAPFETDDQKGDIMAAQTVINIPFSIMSIQSEVPSKDDGDITRGSQMTKLATLDFLQGGVPVDFKPEEKNFNKKYKEFFVDMSEEQRLSYPTSHKGDNIYKLVKDNQNILEEIVKEGVESLTSEFGLSKEGNTYVVTDSEKLSKTLSDALTKREVNYNISAVVKDLKNGTVVAEATPVYQQIRNIIYSIVDRNVMSPKIQGGMKVQIAPTLFESGARKLKDGYYESDILKFYEDKDGKRVCEIMVSRWFESDMSDEELLEYLNTTPEGKKILEGVAFRIPTQKQNSIDVIRIAKFLPREFGDSVIIPSALVKKAGSDFDIDKLNIYFKHVDVNTKTGEIRLIPFHGTGQEAINKFKYRSDYKKSLENGYVESLQRLISHPLNFKNLTKPNSADRMKKLSRDVVKQLGLGEFESNKPGNMLSRRFMSRLRNALVTGKYAIGIAAVNQTSHSLSQRIVSVIDTTRGVYLSNTDNKILGDMEIKFYKHNKIEIDGKSYPTISMIENSEKEYISDILSQLIDGYVDISKDTWIMQLGITPNVASTWMFLIRVGVPIEEIAYFMNQPMIREYLKELERKGSTWLFQSDRYIKKFENRYKGASNISVKTMPIADRMLDMMGKSLKSVEGKQKLSPSEIAEQKFMLREFLKYAKMGEHLFLLTQGTNFDTSTFNDPFLITKKLYQLAKARNTIFTSIQKDGSKISAADAILNNSFLGEMKNGILESREAVSKILISDRGTIRDAVTEVISRYMTLSDRDFIRTSQRAVATLFDWAVQNDKQMISKIEETLISKEKNVAKKVFEFVKTVKEDSSHPLNGNYVINLLTAEFSDPGKNEPNNIVIKNKSNKVYDQNQIIYGFRAIKNYLKSVNKGELYDDLIRLSVLQSGTTPSKISFTNLIPYEDFVDLYNSTLSDLPFKNLDDFVKLNVFERTFWQYDDIVHREKAEYKLDWMSQQFTYNDNMAFSSSIYSAIKEGKIPPLVKFAEGSRADEHDVITYTWELQYDKKTKREMRERGDYSYVKKALFKKLGYVDGKVIYKAINAWGDGIYAKELYNTARKSVMENGFIEVDETITNEQILSYFTGITESPKIEAPKDEVITVVEPTVPSSQPQPTQSTSGPSAETKINIYAGTGENAELSNFAIRPFEDKTEWQGLTFKSVEGAFQAAKIQLSNMFDKNDNLTKEGDELLDKLQEASGAEAKALGRKVTGLNVKEWDRLSSNIMKNLLLESFRQNPNALAKLLATGNATLTHTQDKGKWGTEFPRLLMEVREELRGTQPTSASSDAKPELDIDLIESDWKDEVLFEVDAFSSILNEINSEEDVKQMLLAFKQHKENVKKVRAFVKEGRNQEASDLMKTIPSAIQIDDEANPIDGKAYDVEDIILSEVMGMNNPEEIYNIAEEKVISINYIVDMLEAVESTISTLKEIIGKFSEDENNASKLYETLGKFADKNNISTNRAFDAIIESYQKKPNETIEALQEIYKNC
jgi:predicted NAD-dependent protein-ADP-ribosyltransferase YbiA (DUF1768 family)